MKHLVYNKFFLRIAGRRKSGISGFSVHWKLAFEEHNNTFY
jgi:hypothetical protein